MNRVDRRHSRVFLLLTGLALVGAGAVWLAGPGAVPSVPPLVAAMALAGATIVFGLPHGALDPALAARLGGWRGAGRQALFWAVYLALALAAFGFFLILPGPALILFLGMAMVHFAGDWAVHRTAGGPGTLSGVLLAAPILAGPIAVWPVRTEALFAILTDGATAAAIIDWAFAPAVALLALAAAAIVGLAVRRATVPALEGAALLALSIAVPPLAFFALYWCGLHSPRHLLGAARSLDLARPRALLAATVPVTAATVALGVMLWPLAGGAAIDDRLIRLVFIGLFALSVPHMMLMPLVFRFPWSGASGGTETDRAGIGKDGRSAT